MRRSNCADGVYGHRPARAFCLMRNAHVLANEWLLVLAMVLLFVSVLALLWNKMN
jgi:hypothetical protein